MTQQAKAKYDLDYMRQTCQKLSNWGKWGPDDEIGTMNFITPQKIIAAARLVRKGKVFSLAVPLDSNGPQRPGGQRFNPIHWMLRDGGDVAIGISSGTDDAVALPLQCATQWDSLAHVFFEGKMWNDRGPELVTSFGAQKNSVSNLKDKIVSRGVLLDIARYKGKPWLEPGEAIYAEDLDGCAAKQGVQIGTGDIPLIRTGQMAEVKARGNWGEYAGGSAPGLSITTAQWIHDKEIAAYATDTWGTEVIPNETDVVFQPLHRIVIPYVGILMGEIFDLEELAEDCAQDGVYEFMFVAPPLTITGAVGSPPNPQAIK
ncbi:MAG: cyclase family protein [Dehalococcoidia bacterium]